MKKPWLLLGLFAMAGCATVYTSKGAYHRVRSKETLASIAQSYHSTVQEIAEYNNIDDAAEVKEGRSIYIPGVKVSGGLFPFLEGERKHRGHHRAKAHKTKGRKAENKAVTPEVGVEAPATPEDENKIFVDHSHFSWPVTGELSSLFGIRHGRKHDGIDIRAHRGTPVHAAAAGEVVFCKRMRGYGNLVLLKHPDNLFTVYAHNSAILVKNGKKVKKGDVISKVGSTGKATGPHLHFEVRDGRRARNPLFFLPKNQYALRAKTEGPKGTNGDE